MATKNTEEVIVEVEETVVESAKNLIVEARDNAHKAFSASLGAVMWVNDEVNEFVGEFRGKTEKQVDEVKDSADSVASKMIERGANIQTDTRKRIEEVVEARRAALNERTDVVLSKFDGVVESLLTRVNLPTKDSIDQLNKKINTLGRKIDQVRKQQENLAA